MSFQGWAVPSTTPVRTLFTWCVDECGVDRLLLSARLRKDQVEPTLLTPEVDSNLCSVVGDQLLSRKLVRKWPGTELTGHVGMVYEIAFDSALIDSLARLGPRLQHWRMTSVPALPEDPCLYQQGASWPVLVSVTHEGDAWILSENWPPFCPGPSFDFKPENLLVPPAAEGFVKE